MLFLKENDGIDHINVYSKGKTELGRLLSNFAFTPFTIDGETFPSVESWWYWIKMQNINKKVTIFTKAQIENIKEKIGVEAKKYFRGFYKSDTKEFDPTKEQLKIVYLQKLKENSKIKELLLKNNLPFAHYYVMFEKQIEANDYYWTVLIWNEIKEEIN